MQEGKEKDDENRGRHGDGASRKRDKTKRKKFLRLVISENMNWTDQVNKTVRKCKFKLSRSLKKLFGSR